MKSNWLTIGIFALAWVVSLLIAGLVGYNLKRITESIANITFDIPEYEETDEEEVESEPVSSFYDPNDMIQQAQFEQDEINRKLNS